MVQTLVPALVGLSVQEATELAGAAGLGLVAADPIVPLAPAGSVVAQEPLAGTRLPAGAEITVEVRGGGDGGGGSPVAPVPAPLEPTGSKLPA